MTKDEALKANKWRGQRPASSTGAVYGLGFIGALVYYFQHADTFWLFVLGILKAIVWPAIVVHQLLAFLYK